MASAAAFSRAPSQAPHTRSTVNRAAASRRFSDSAAVSRLRNSRSKRVTTPSNRMSADPVRMSRRTVNPEPCSSSRRSSSPNSASGRSLSKRPDPPYRFHSQLPTDRPGSSSAPSFSDFDQSIARSRSRWTVRPTPSHSGHIPAGSLNEYAVAPPALGVPHRENSTRITDQMSVAVPTVDRTLPPSGFWSITMATDRSSTDSTCGRSYFGSRLRRNEVNVSFSCRCDSTAIVSKTTEDLPEPETPVKTVIRPLGTRRETSRRLFSRAPVMTMSRWAEPGAVGSVSRSGMRSMATTLEGIPDSFCRLFHGDRGPRAGPG